MTRNPLHRCLATAAFLALPLSALGAGMTTHSYMAAEAIQYVETEELKNLLELNRLDVIAGGTYPDSGYYIRDVNSETEGSLGENYGEDSHWEYFINPYAEHVRKKCGRGDGREELRTGIGPCARLVGHLMGSAAHGMGDELWDWLFEPLMGQHGELPENHLLTTGLPGWGELSQIPGAGGPLTAGVSAQEDAARPSLIRSSEYAMDVVAINDPAHAQVAWSLTEFPVEDLVAVYQSMGKNVTREAILAGHAGMNAILAAERLSILDYTSVKNNFPYTAPRLGTESGGVQYTAKAIAAYYESVWKKVTESEHPAPRVATVHPEPGETGIATKLEVGHLGGAGPKGGRADNRILAAFSNSVDPATITPETFYLRDSEGNRVAPAGGYPRSGPYNWGSGNGVTHSMIFHSNQPLRPCTTYTAEITTALKDHAGAGLTAPYSWSFETICP